MADTMNTDPVVREAYELAQDYIAYVTRRSTGPAPSPAARALRYAGDELLVKFPIFFKRWPRIFKGVTEDEVCNLLVQMIDDSMKEFWDRQKRQTGYPRDIPWSTVLSVYVLGGQLAVYCQDHGMEKVLGPLAERVGLYMEEKICPVIKEKGGWVGFTKRYEKNEDLEGKVLQICCTVLITLSALLVTYLLWKRKMSSP
ncbi:bcl-2-like protein 2 [Gastrophryne carolinensis]